MVGPALSFRRIAHALLIAGFVVIVTGCSSNAEGGPISGTVTLEGKPISDGAVTFHSRDGRTGSSEIIGGQYTIRKAPTGVCRITVLTAPRGDSGPPVEGPTSGLPEQKSKGGYVPVPPRYHTPATSDLNYTVTPGPQTYDINLTK